jgi:hypothetical protein
MPADPASMIFWLTNRCPDRWKRAPTVEVEHNQTDRGWLEEIEGRFLRLKAERDTLRTERDQAVERARSLEDAIAGRVIEG